MFKLENWLERWLLYIGLAVMGGALGYLMRAKDGQRVRWGRVALEGLSAGFVGFLVLLMCLAGGMSEYWTGLIVGVSGWLGANATIGMLERVVYSKLGLRQDDFKNVDSHDRNGDL